MTPPTVLVTPSHKLAKRPQDAMALWIQHPSVDSFTLCVRETKLFDGLHQNIKIVSNYFVLLLLLLFFKILLLSSVT